MCDYYVHRQDHGQAGAALLRAMLPLKHDRILQSAQRVPKRPCFGARERRQRPLDPACVRRGHAGEQGSSFRRYSNQCAAPVGSTSRIDGPRAPRVDSMRKVSISGHPHAWPAGNRVRLRERSAIQRATRASTRHGLPVPPAIFSGAVISSAPVGGSRSRLARLAKPNLLAPCIRV